MQKKRTIISRTPVRITFVGGGTDIPEYYKNNARMGAVISAAIDKYVYIIVHKSFDDTIRLGYSKTEIVNALEDIKHPLIRESLKFLDIDGGVEIHSLADIPSEGTGLGSSSCYLVGLLNALHAWKGEYATPLELAQEAVHIERNILKEAGGRQDQYIAAFGGIQFMKFKEDDTVDMIPIIMSEESRKKLQNSLLLLYTGVQRSSIDIHKKQVLKIQNYMVEYDKMVLIANKMFEDLTNQKWSTIGKYLNENWLIKRELSDGITNQIIDKYYERGMKVGAEGGKIIGAGGGGFMLFFAPQEKHPSIINELNELRHVPFKFTEWGSRIIYVGD